MRQPSTARQSEATGGRLPLALPAHVAKGCFGFGQLIQPILGGWPSRCRGESALEARSRGISATSRLRRLAFRLIRSWIRGALVPPRWSALARAPRAGARRGLRSHLARDIALLGLIQRGRRSRSALSSTPHPTHARRSSEA